MEKAHRLNAIAMAAPITSQEFLMELLRALNLPRRMAALITIFSLGFIGFGLFAFQTLAEL